ncbi:MAG: flagellar biosynthesis protein FlhF, partial [Tepidanaerobacteraceae bacterium]|nr:flagellar biosynthesis protein FlhF [Tepidanaerobacteraceae bacterium]
MKIKTYIADNVQEAFYKVKTDLGKDAVILQTKQIRKGGFFGFFAKRMVEVVAANDISLRSDLSEKPPLNPLPKIAIKPRDSTTLGGI